MSFGANQIHISLPAAADYSAAGQYQAVSVDTNGNAVLASVAGQSVIGILQNKPTNGGAATVCISGITKMVASGAIAAGALISCDATGKAKVASKTVVNSTVSSATDAVIGSDVIGVALAAATAAGDIIAVLLQPRGGVPTTAA